MECKAQKAELKHDSYAVLIETLLNVKSIDTANASAVSFVLIETLWNVKIIVKVLG